MARHAPVRVMSETAILRAGRHADISRSMPRPAQPRLLLLIVPWLMLMVGTASFGLASMPVEAPLFGAGLGVLSVGSGLLCIALRGSGRELATLRQLLVGVECERDALLVANVELRNDNVALRSMDVAFRDVLNLADERSHGQLRNLVGQIGDTLAEWLEEQMNDRGAQT
jgi:hypothetical protein